MLKDPTRYKQSPAITDDIFDDGYHRPSPAAGYTKERTGAIYPLDLSLHSAAFKLKQVLNDAAMRVPITEVGKLIDHPDFAEAFSKYYGKEYQGALQQWIKDLAGNRQWVPSNIQGMNRVITSLQNNMSTFQIGWNLGTVLKHAPSAALLSAVEVGPGNFIRELSRLIRELPGSQESWNFAMEHSEELQNRMHSNLESLSAIDKEMFPTWTGKWGTAREAIQRIGHTPVAWTDLISAVAMWNAEYKRLLKDPEMTIGDAIYAADTAVRRTHGSSLLGYRTAIMRQGPLVRGIMPYYNFFSNVLQRNYESMWTAKARMKGMTLPEMPGFDEEVFKKSSALAAKSAIGGLLIFGVGLSLVEEAADKLTGREGPKDEGWGRYIFRVLSQAEPAQVPGVRDAFGYLYHGYDPKLGYYGSFERMAKNAIPSKAWIKDPGTTFRRANEVGGLLRGMTFDPVGRAGQFWITSPQGRSTQRVGLTIGKEPCVEPWSNIDDNTATKGNRYLSLEHRHFLRAD